MDLSDEFEKNFDHDLYFIVLYNASLGLDLVSAPTGLGLGSVLPDSGSLVT